MAITWHEETMGTGIPEIDAQHKELIARLDRLIQAMLRRDSRAEVEKLVPFLGEYASWHFGKEEACMDAHRCPVAQANRSAHMAFLRLFAELAGRIEKEGPTATLTIQLQREVSDWVRNHIVRVDTRLKECVQRKDAPASQPA